MVVVGGARVVIVVIVAAKNGGDCGDNGVSTTLCLQLKHSKRTSYYQEIS